MTFAIIHIVDTSATVYGAGVPPGWVKIQSGIAGNYSARYRARHDERRIDLSFVQDSIYFRVCFAKDARGISCGFVIAFSSLLVRRCLIDVFLRAAASLDELSYAGKCPLLQFKDAGARQQGRFRQQQIGTIYREQDFSLLNVIPDVEKSLDNFAWILGRNVNQHVLIEVNRTHGGLEALEVADSTVPISANQLAFLTTPQTALGNFTESSPLTRSEAFRSWLAA
jgi:hypothetical protein